MPGVKAYHIKEIILAPDNASLVFLIQKEEQDTRGEQHSLHGRDRGDQLIPERAQAPHRP